MRSRIDDNHSQFLFIVLTSDILCWFPRSIKVHFGRREIPRSCSRLRTVKWMANFLPFWDGTELPKITASENFHCSHQRSTFCPPEPQSKSRRFEFFVRNWKHRVHGSLKNSNKYHCVLVQRIYQQKFVSWSYFRFELTSIRTEDVLIESIVVVGI